MSTEAAEDCILLERAFLRIGSADTDQQFEALIDKLLGPIIFKVSSPDGRVQQKAIELLTHISKRIKCRPQVQLPVHSLLQLYFRKLDDNFVKNFLTVYIKLGFSRLNDDEQLKCISTFLKCIESPGTDQLKHTFLNLTLKCCKHFTNAKHVNEFVAKNDLKNWSHVDVLLDHFYYGLLLPYTHTLDENNSTDGSAPPGMCPQSYKYLTQDGQFENFVQVKLGILNLLAASKIPIERKYSHYVVASVDTNSEVAELGKHHTKLSTGTFELSENVLRPLYSLFVGDDDNMIPNRRKTPADLRIKIILLPVLQRMNVYCWPECIQVVVSCVKEASNAKIKISGLNFGLAALQKSGIDGFKEVSPNFLSVLCEMIWSEKEETVRMLIYRLAGNVISLNPELVKYHEKLFPKFIEDLTEEKSPTVRNTIKESLLKMANAFKRTETPGELMHFLANRITSPEPSVKQIVLHYLHQAFASDHIESRFLLCWASADNDPNVAKEAETVLLDDLKTYESSEAETKKLPKFARLLNFVYDGLRAKEATLRATFPLGDQNLPLTKRTYVKFLSYVRKCMLYDCHPPLCINASFEHPCSYSPIIGSYLRKLYANDSAIAEQYLELVWLTLTVAQEIEPIQCFVECVGTVPDIFAPLYLDKLEFFQKLLSNFAENFSFIAAIAMGTILTYGCKNSNEIKNTLNVVVDRLTSKNIDHDEYRGSLYYLGSIAERGGFEKVGGVPRTVIDIVVDSLNHSTPTIAAAACYCIGQIVRKNYLPLPNRTANESSKYEKANSGGEHDVVDASKPDDKSLTKLKIVDKLLDLVFEKNTVHKVKTKAAEALGFFCIGDHELPFRELIIKVIVEKERDEKIAGASLNLGHVIADCVMGRYSVHSIDLWTQKEAEFKLPSGWNHAKERELLLFAFRKIADELIWNEKCKSKTAGAIWLLVLVKRCGEIPLELEELSKMQYTFLELMSRNDDIIHEAATRGLSFVSKFANEENTTILAKQLTDRICLMQKGITEMGAVLGMYEEFGYLVSSLKNHSLIYHFLNLLNHQNLNNDEKYALTFTDDEAVSIEALKPYLTQIAPSLYVYRYHQSSKIKHAMNTIWSKLFSKNVKAVSSYSKTILEAAIKELTCPNPELRIAYCLALENLLQIEGNSFISENKKLMPQLLSSLYRLMDDRKESVRKVAYGTTKMFLQAFVKNIHRDKCSESVDNELLNDLFPILLNNGVSSTVDDIRSISIKTFSDIIDHLGSLIKSHLHYFVPSMIENVNEIETSIRYVDERIREVVEDLKEGFLAKHFSTEIIKKCMNYIDEEVLEKMLPKLSELLKDNTSYTVRLAAINFVVMLTSHIDVAKLQPFVGKLLGALFGGLSNYHKNVRKSTASAIGVLCKSAKESSIDNLLNKLVQLYMKNTNDENVKSAIGQTILAIGTHCQDAVQARSEKIVPIIFFAMHLKKTPDGSNDSFIELWKEVWNDVIGSMEVALVKHKIPIIVVLKEAFNSPSWNTKTQAARAFATFVSKCSDDLQTCEELQSLIQDIVTTLGGKFWRGKEELLDPVATACSRKTMVNEKVRQQILEAVLRECGRGSITYRTSALEALGKIYAYSDYDKRYFECIYDMLRNLIAEDGSVDKNFEDMETEEVSVVSNQQIKLKETAFSVLGTVWPEDERVQALYQLEIVKMLTDNLFASTRQSQVSIMVSLKIILSKSEIMKKTVYSSEEETLLGMLMENVETSLRYALELKKHTLLKKEALHVIINLMETFTEYSNMKCVERLVNVYTDHANQLSKDTDPIIVLQTSKLKELLKRNVC